MVKLWDRIKARLTALNPDVAESFNPPATNLASLERLGAQSVIRDLTASANEQELRTLMQPFGARGTEDFTASLRVHDGQDGRYALMYP